MVSRLIITLLLLASPVLGWTGADWAAMLELSAMRGPQAAAPAGDWWIPATVNTQNMIGYWRPGVLATSNSVTSAVALQRFGNAVITTNIGLVFDGDEDMARISANAFITGNVATISAWIFIRKHRGSHSTIYCQSDVALGHSAYNFTALTGGLMVVDHYLPSGAPMTNKTTISTGAWHHVAFVQSNTTFKIYLNGALDNSGTAETPESMALVDYTHIGGNLFGSSVINDFDGYIDEVIVATDAWTDSQVGLYYTNAYTGEYQSR